MEKVLDWIAKKFCKRKRYSRAEVRKLWPKPKPVEEDLSSGEEEEEIEEEVDADVVKKDVAMRKIQRFIRGFIGRKRALQQANLVMQEVDAYWLDHYARKLEEERQKLLLMQARRQAAKGFVKDLISVSVLYIISVDDASTTIQRSWRGYWVRKHLPKPRPPPKMRPKPRALKGRLLPETLRRVWARSLFEPSKNGGFYLHKTDIGYKKYDLWKHAQRPPEGNPHGLRTRKIVLPAKDSAENIRLGKTVFAATDDRHAWLGVPVGLEDYDVKERGKYIRSFRNLERFLFTFPDKNSKNNLENDEINHFYNHENHYDYDDNNGNNVTEAVVMNPYAQKLFDRKKKSSVKKKKKQNQLLLISDNTNNTNDNINTNTVVTDNNSDSDIGGKRNSTGINNSFDASDHSGKRRDRHTRHRRSRGSHRHKHKHSTKNSHTLLLESIPESIGGDEDDPHSTRNDNNDDNIMEYDYSSADDHQNNYNNSNETDYYSSDNSIHHSHNATNSEDSSESDTDASNSDEEDENDDEDSNTNNNHDTNNDYYNTMNNSSRNSGGEYYDVGLPDVSLTRRKLHFLRSVAQQHSRLLQQRLQRITVLEAGETQRGAKHWDALTGRYLQYLGDGRYRHVRSGKDSTADTQKSQNKQSNSNNKNNKNNVSHNQRQHAEEALPLNLYDTNLLTTNTKISNSNSYGSKQKKELSQVLQQVVLLPANLANTFNNNNNNNSNNIMKSTSGSVDGSLSAVEGTQSLDRVSVTSSLQNNNNSANTNTNINTNLKNNDSTLLHTNTHTNSNGGNASVSVLAVNTDTQSLGLLGRSATQAKVLQSGLLSVRDTLYFEERQSVTQKQKAFQHRRLFHESFRPSATLSSAANNQPALIKNVPAVTSVHLAAAKEKLHSNNSNSNTKGNVKNSATSSWQQLKEHVETSLLTQTSQNPDSILAVTQTAQKQSRASRSLSGSKSGLSRRVPHYRHVYTWLPQPLLAAALQQHHYVHLSAAAAYQQQQEEEREKEAVLLSSSSRLAEHSEFADNDSDGYASHSSSHSVGLREDDDGSLSLSLHALSLTSVSQNNAQPPHHHSNNNSNKSDFLASDSVLSALSQRPSHRLKYQESETGVTDTRPKVITFTSKDFDSDQNTNNNNNNSSDKNRAYAEKEEDYNKNSYNNNHMDDDLSSRFSFRRNQNSNNNTTSSTTSSPRKRSNQHLALRSAVEADLYFASDEEDDTNNNKTRNLDHTQSLDSTASLRKFTDFLAASRIPQTIPDVLVRRRQTVTDGLRVSSQLTVTDTPDHRKHTNSTNIDSSIISSSSNSNSNSNNSGSPHRKFQDRPSVHIPGPSDYLQHTTNNNTTSSNANRRTHSRSHSVSVAPSLSMAQRLASFPPRDAKIAPATTTANNTTNAAANSYDNNITLNAIPSPSSPPPFNSTSSANTSSNKNNNMRLGSALEQNSLSHLPPHKTPLPSTNTTSTAHMNSTNNISGNKKQLLMKNGATHSGNSNLPATVATSRPRPLLPPPQSPPSPSHLHPYSWL